MLTPAKRHFDSVMAQNRGNGQASLAELTAYEQILHRLRVDKNRLSGIQSKKTKAEEKLKLLPDYQGWVDGVLAADSGQADEVLTRVMLWHIDAGNIPEALRIGEYVIRHGLAMPDRFNRTAAVTMIDEICDPVLAGFKASANLLTVSADLLKALDGLTATQDVPEQVRAKLWKAIGYTLRTVPETQPDALEYLKKAIAEFSEIGVKRDIEQLDRLLKKMAPTGNGDTAASETGKDIPEPDEAASNDAAAPAVKKPATPRKGRPAAKTSRAAKSKRTVATKNAATVG